MLSAASQGRAGEAGREGECLLMRLTATTAFHRDDFLVISCSQSSPLSLVLPLNFSVLLLAAVVAPAPATFHLGGGLCLALCVCVSVVVCLFIVWWLFFFFFSTDMDSCSSRSSLDDGVNKWGPDIQNSHWQHQRGQLVPGMHLPAPKRTCNKKHFQKKKSVCCSLPACRQDQGSASCFVLHLLPPFIALITAVTLQSWAVFLPGLWKTGFCTVPLCLLQCLPLTCVVLF